MFRVLLVAVVTAAMLPIGVLAQATPVATEPCQTTTHSTATADTGGKFIRLGAFWAGYPSVSRDFVAPGARLIGTLVMEFVSVRFDDVDAASRATKSFAPEFIAGIHHDTTGVRRASLEPLGDEAIAYAGMVHGDDQGEQLVLALIVVRTDVFLRIGVGFSLATDPLLDVLTALRKSIPHEATNHSVTCDQDGFHRGGIWDTLPDLDDLPSGFVLDGESWHQ